MVNPSDPIIRNDTRQQAQPNPEDLADDPQIIRSQIKRTRAQMGHTMDEIQMRLSPDYIKQQTQETIREATVEKVEKMAQTAEHKVNNWRSNMVQTIKDNPLPAAMVGLGLGWLFFSDSSNDNPENYPVSSDVPYPYYPSARANYTPQYDSQGNLLTEAQARAAQAKENAKKWAEEKSQAATRKVKNTTENLQEQAATTAEAVGEVSTQAQQYVSETAEQLRERTEEARIQAQQAAAQMQHQAQRQTRRTKRTFWNTMEENPMAVGIAAIAAGALVGMALPSTEKENMLLGETRDRLVEEVAVTAQEKIGKAQTVVEQAANKAAEEAKREVKGLSN